jgi:hypothetical protein
MYKPGLSKLCARVNGFILDNLVLSLSEKQVVVMDTSSSLIPNEHPLVDVQSFFPPYFLFHLVGVMCLCGRKLTSDCKEQTQCCFQLSVNISGTACCVEVSQHVNS